MMEQTETIAGVTFKTISSGREGYVDGYEVAGRRVGAIEFDYYRRKAQISQDAMLPDNWLSLCKVPT